MERGEKFVAEGKVEIGPKEQFFMFLGGEHLGRTTSGCPQSPATKTWGACASRWSR